MADWAAMVEARDAEIVRLLDLLRYEHERANAATDREEATEQHAEELGAEVSRLRAGLAYETRINWFTTCANCARLLDSCYSETMRADRYRLAWLSARRRDCVNSNHATEALELKNQEITRLRAALAEPRKSTSADPRLEFMGTEEDGGTVFLLAGADGPPRNSPQPSCDN
ncbi:hypothetical protein ACFVZM_06635 [Streptomyces sioyaensis]|uniref:hypothetical protein n=1 Tax=Streptomyces sioyaensis TaxID=67364 RepID=UPI0036D165C2